MDNFSYIGVLELIVKLAFFVYNGVMSMFPVSERAYCDISIFPDGNGFDKRRVLKPMKLVIDL